MSRVFIIWCIRNLPEDKMISVEHKMLSGAAIRFLVKYYQYNQKLSVGTGAARSPGWDIGIIIIKINISILTRNISIGV